MKKILFVIALCAVINTYGEQKYNPYSEKFETTSPDAQLEYNPFSNSHSYVPRPAGQAPRMEYNAYENNFELVPVTEAPTYELSPPSSPRAPSPARF